MSAADLLQRFRALGGVADNVQLRQGPHGWGLFVVDPEQPVRVFTPAHLLIAPQDLRLSRDGQVQVRPQATLGLDAMRLATEQLQEVQEYVDLRDLLRLAKKLARALPFIEQPCNLAGQCGLVSLSIAGLLYQTHEVLLPFQSCFI